jgi:hypothetical protein
MTMDQPDGFLDIDRPDGERIRVRFRGEAARRPEVAAGLVELLLAADGNIYEAVTDYANGLHLGASYYLGAEWISIEMFEPLTLHPLVNASGGSPVSSANRHPGKRAFRPLARLLPARRAVGRSSGPRSGR